MLQDILNLYFLIYQEQYFLIREAIENKGFFVELNIESNT